MQEVSAKWASALTTAHGISTKVSLLYNGSLVAEDIAFIDGSVTVDRGSETRRSLSLTVPDPSVFPFSPTDPYAVYGQRVYVESGIRYMDGTIERVPVGTFLLTGISGDIHTGPMTISGAGLEMLFKLSIAETAFSTAGYTSANTLLSYLVSQTDATLGFVSSATHGADALATTTWDAGTTYWQIMTDVSQSIGAEVYVDADATVRLADVPSVSTVGTPVWDVAAGESGIMVSASLALSSDDVYNKVIVAGENTADNAPPVRGSATITDSSDPLHYGGPFGKRVLRLTSSLVKTATQGNIMAAAELERRRAPNKTVSCETIPNAALDVGDWVRIAPLSQAASPELHLVQSFSLPLSLGSQGFSFDTVGGHEA